MMKNTWKIFSQTFLLSFWELKSLKHFVYYLGNFAFLTFWEVSESWGDFLNLGNSIEKSHKKCQFQKL
jgi:hypothetical protein